MRTPVAVKVCRIPSKVTAPTDDVLDTEVVEDEEARS